MIGNFDLGLLFENISEEFSIHELIYDRTGKAVDYIILEVNSVYENNQNTKREKVVGCHASDLIGIAIPPLLGIYSRVVKTGNTEEIEYYCPSLEKYFMIRVFAIDGDKFATLIIDVTAWAQVADELEKYRDYLKILVKDRTIELEEQINKQRKILGYWAGREARNGELRVAINILHEQLEEAGLEPLVDAQLSREEATFSLLRSPAL
jgi:hypothetical protein